jgi:hypothetical protein
MLSPVMVMGRIEACLLPFRCHSLTSGSSFHICSGWRLRGLLCWVCAFAQGLTRILGVGESGYPLVESDEAEPALLGSGEADPTPGGRVRQSLRSKGRMEPRLRPLIVRGELIVDDHQSPFFRYPNIGTTSAGALSPVSAAGGTLTMAWTPMNLRSFLRPNVSLNPRWREYFGQDGLGNMVF